MTASKPKLFVLLGPTAVGKTALSFRLADELRSPILSADSRQMYADLKIGTAAPTEHERSQYKHYFVGNLRLTDYYSAAQYETEVIELLSRLHPVHPAILMSGGSMMYIDAVCKGIDDIPTVDEETRRTMKLRLEHEGLEALCQELKRLDPEYYAIVDTKNHKRIVHALEICHMSGKTYTSFRQNIRKERPFEIIKIGLRRERADLFDRINRRVDLMMHEGLLAEAQSVYPFRHLNSLNTVGYKELFAYFDGVFDLPTAIERIKKNTRVYAKKQMTWFQKDTEITWFHPDDEAGILRFVRQKLC